MLVVEGGRTLNGRIGTSGAKNAALPALAACLLTTEEVRLVNVPELADTRLMVEILSSLGVRAEPDGDELVVQAARATSIVPSELSRRIRASIVLLGALLARVGEVTLPTPGGDAIGARRVGEHLRGLRALGATIEEMPDAIVARAPRGLHGAEVVLDLPTVTGTENIMLAAATARGRTEIHNAAREPHVQNLAELLRAMGADVRGAGTERIVMNGVPELGGCRHRVISDYLEAGTYALAVAAAGGEVTLEFDRVDDLAHPLRKLAQTGVDVEVADGVIQVRKDPDSPLRGEDVSTWVHPGFPSDLQAQYLALMTQAAGPSLIQEWLYENRFQHVPQLVRMGADIQVRERSALVRGPSRLRGTSVEVTDIRSGAALLIAALCAEGTSELHDAWHLGRGYEDLVGKLARLGARLELRGRDA